MRAEAGLGTVRGRGSTGARRGEAKPSARLVRPILSVVGALLVIALALGIAYAGAADRIAGGITVSGVDVEGKTAAEAEAMLAARARELSLEPVPFTAAGTRWEITPSELDVRANWAGAAAAAEEKGDWPFPIRGLKRLYLAAFGADVEPLARASDSRLAARVTAIAHDVDEAARNAAIELDGFEPVIVPSEEGRELARERAGETIVAALASFERDAVALPVVVDRPAVTADELRPVAAQVRTALSAPVRFGWADARWLVSPQQLADLLLLPANGRSALAIGGQKADRYFEQLAQAVDRKARDARFVPAADGSVRIVPARDGRELDSVASAKALLAGALSTGAREADIVVHATKAELTTRKAQAMGIEAVMARYMTSYSGTADRIHNLQLAIDLLDGTRLRPGQSFSLNEIVGPRTKERGFRRAPTIMDGEYKDEYGGGVSQVATTIFNAAWEAGLKITERTAHSLYISRYPLGRDATVNYPDLDLEFVNDTKGWLYVDGSYDEAGIQIRIFGEADSRRVVSEAGLLEEIAPPEIERVPDSTLYVGDRIVVDDGEPARAVTVTRTVYEGGKVLYDERWRTSYDSEPQIVRVGTQPRPAPPAPSAPSSTGATTTAPSTTGPTTTGPND